MAMNEPIDIPQALTPEEFNAFQAKLYAPCTDIDEAVETLLDFDYVEIVGARTYRDSNSVLWTFENDAQLIAHANQGPLRCPHCQQYRVFSGLVCGVCAKGMNWQGALEKNTTDEAVYHGWPIDGVVNWDGDHFAAATGFHSQNSDCNENLASEEDVSAYLREHGIDPESGWRSRWSVLPQEEKRAPGPFGEPSLVMAFAWGCLAMTLAIVVWFFGLTPLTFTTACVLFGLYLFVRSLIKPAVRKDETTTKVKALLKDADASMLILMSAWLIVMSLLSAAIYLFGANVVTMTLLAGVLVTFGWLFSRNLERASLL